MYNNALIEVGPVWSILTGRNLPLKQIDKVCSYFFEGAHYSEAFKDGRWDGKIRLFNKGKFPTGLLFMVNKVLVDNKVDVKIDMRFSWPVKQYEWELIPTPKPRQQEAINALIQYKRGMMQLPTRFGKTSMVASGTIAALGVPTLFVAHQLDLIYDAKRTFEEYIGGVGEVGVIGGGEYTLKPLTVACIDSLALNIKDPKMQRYLGEVVKYVIVDECQFYGSKQYKEVINRCNAPHRLLFSATATRSGGATVELHAASGKMIYELTEEAMIEEGYIADVNIEFIPFNHKLFNEGDRGLKYAPFYNEFIVENSGRNQLIVDETKKMVHEEGRYVLIIVTRIEHGKILKEMLQEQGIPDVEFIWGETSASDRITIRENFNSGKFRVFIGSTIFDVGINVPIASGLVIAAAGDSETRTPQRVGRILCDMVGKVAKAIDIRDDNIKWFSKQSKHRYQYCIERFGDSRVSVRGTECEASKKYGIPGLNMFDKLNF